jgi:FixJ family two-component response regulator
MVQKTGRTLVAVVEDDRAARAALGRVLQAGGFDPLLFDSAEALMASWPDDALLCLIVDVQLTGMSGIDLLRQLRAGGCRAPIIVTTGNRAERIREHAHQAGCEAFLFKPFSAEALLGLVHAIERTSRP